MRIPVNIFLRTGNFAGKTVLRLRVVFCLFAFLLLSFSCTGLQIVETGGSRPPEHPRLILTGDFLELTRRRCAGTRRELFERLRETVDGYLKSDMDSIEVRHVARLAEKCAFFYLIEGRRDYLDAGLKFLDRALDRYVFLEREHGGGYWEVVEFRRYCGFAYDWMYQAMTPEQRKQFGGKILEAGEIAWESHQRWCSLYGGGGYGSVDPVFWPAVTLAGSGVNDSLAGIWLERMGEILPEWAEILREVASDDGGMFSGMAYAAYNYLRTPIFDFEIWKNLTGNDLTKDHAYLSNFPVWWLYCLKPNGEWLKMDDTRTVTGRIHPWHFKYLASRYNDPVSAWYLENLADSTSITIWDVLWDPEDLGIHAAGPDNSWPLARHFEGIGWVIMRSGWDEAHSTQAVFDCGDFYYGHQHPAENQFVIFHKGSLAINSGRYEWGSDHRPNYMGRTIASNTMLIYDKDEKFITSGGDTQVNNGPDGRFLSNDGGQKWPRKGRMRYTPTEGTEWDTGDIVAFETNRYFSYTCGDATASYSPHKLKSFTRQFLHIQPDIFVVFDRVESVRDDYRKIFLLHTINEPEIEGRTMKVGEREGVLFCTTVIPDKANLRKVGGPGHEFDIFGKNYPPALTHYPKTNNEEWGAWRLEVEPAEPGEADFFLHVLAVGDSSSASTPELNALNRGEESGVEFTYQGQDYRVLFQREGPPGGSVRITAPSGEVLWEKPLAREVQPQAGIGRVN
ncbi:heparinase II/III family protein [Gemmatimonadota bacterium]